MSSGWMVRLAFLAVIAACTIIDLRRGPDRRSLARLALGAFAIGVMLFTAGMWIDHLRFPLHLDLMEGTVLQHAVRAASGQVVYPEPSAAFVPLAYNPLYYYLAAPAIWVLGPSLATLRLVSIVGMAGSGLVMFLAVRRRTGSAWWGLMAAAMFAAAYHVMDSYLDTAHSDSWLICAALLGTYLIDRARSTGERMAGVIVLVASFWFKQHGALFAIAGVLYLTWQGGVRASLPYWAAAIVLGPLAYAAATTWPFGPEFHFFTWSVPRGWSRLDADTVTRLISFAITWYPFVLLFALWAFITHLRAPRARLTIWDFQFAAGAASAAMGALDWGSSNNVFIPFGAFTIVLGTFALAAASDGRPGALRSAVRAAVPLAVALAFAPFFYDLRLALLPDRAAAAAYQDLSATVRGLGSAVYEPDIGYGGSDLPFAPNAHWVALEDLGRGPGHDQADRTLAWQLLDPLSHPAGQPLILTNKPLALETPPVGLLSRYYILERDYGERFSALRGLPKRYDHGYPRYLYRYQRADSDTNWVVPR